MENSLNSEEMDHMPSKKVKCHKENDIEHPDIEISREIVHPDYSVTNIASLTNDIMLIKLSKPAMFSKYVRPICLPNL